MSWNVNGLRAVVKKDSQTKSTPLRPTSSDCRKPKPKTTKCVKPCLVGIPTRCTRVPQSKKATPDAVLTKHTPLSIQAGIGVEALDQEGRVLRLEFDNFHFVTVYTPNSSSGLKRLPFRGTWDEAFKDYLKELDADKPVVCCGDLNVAHAPIDLARPKSNYNKTPGYTQQEIDGMSALLDAGFVDTWRQAHPEDVKYSWWSYRGGAREKNVGWRLDYMLVSERALAQTSAPQIHNDIHGSDHCPVSLEWQG